LAGRLLSAQEEERRLLARELHDDLSQRLAIISIGIGKLERLSGSVPDEVVAQLKEIRERVIDLSSDVHDISRQLHPSIIEDLGLDRAIQSECASFTQREGIRVHYKSEDVPAAIPIDTAVCLFRVVQEGMRNIARHAKVKEADVSLTGAEDRIVLMIQDAGVGFDVSRPAGRPALGLTSMKERTHLIRGEFVIESTRGMGTTITVVAPLSGMQK
jgi:signal transduction histidine kinase